jgi:hypothetical protein
MKTAIPMIFTSFPKKFKTNSNIVIKNNMALEIPNELIFTGLVLF